jgi:hypothetical protein
MIKARTLLTLISVLTLFPVAHAEARTLISSESLLPNDPTTHYSRLVNFAPGDGDVVDLNPPRFRWFYHPHPSRETVSHIYSFRFQIARDAAFTDLIVDIETPYNFHNTMGPVSGSDIYY